MAWVFDHIQIILFVGGIVAYWLNQRRREKAGESADYDGDGVPDVQARPSPTRRIDPRMPDPEEAERTRRIQEEIRRKIAERRGQSTPTSSAQPPRPPPLSPRSAPTEPGPRPRLGDAPRPTAEGPLPEVLRRLLDPHRDDPDRLARERLEAAERSARERQARQREVEAEQAQRDAERAAAFREATAKREWEASQQKARSPLGNSRTLVADLRDPASLRRAVILREVLGLPVGLR